MFIFIHGLPTNVTLGVRKSSASFDKILVSTGAATAAAAAATTTTTTVVVVVVAVAGDNAVASVHIYFELVF